MHYFAGLFDAEGYVTLNKDGRFQIGTEVTNEEIPKLFKERFGGNIYPRTRDKRKKTWTWVISTNIKETLNFISQIQPYSIIKNGQLGLLKSYLSNTRENRKIIRSNFSHDIALYKKPIREPLKGLTEVPLTIDFFKWFAGFIDGDGNFCIYEYAGKKSQIFDSWIGIFNIFPEPIEYVLQHFKGSISKYKGTKFPIWKWVCNQKNSQLVCESVYPFLQIKKEQCKLVMEFLEIQKTKTRNTVYSFDQINRIRDIIKQIKHLNSL
jgi:hypothetical protein